jgi:hypothetical protein
MNVSGVVSRKALSQSCAQANSFDLNLSEPTSVHLAHPRPIFMIGPFFMTSLKDRVL